MNTFVPILLVVALLAVLGVLFAGIFAMARGGDFNRRYGNRLMRWRVILQALAIALFALLMLAAKD